jgi:hypothetical protein
MVLVQVVHRIVHEGDVAEIDAELEVVRRAIDGETVLDLPPLFRTELVEVVPVGETRKRQHDVVALRADA